jgi:hypothetical protein
VFYVLSTSLVFCKPNTLDEDILPNSSLRNFVLFLTTSSALGTDILLETLFPDTFWGGEVCTGFWWGSLRELGHWGDPNVDGRIILGWIFRKWKEVVGTGWSGLRIRTGGGHL